jgi:hypothetical protein
MSKAPGKNKQPAVTYQVQFKTVAGGYITTVDVTLSEGVMDIIDTARVDLADHPLYPALQRYVLDNPR